MSVFFLTLFVVVTLFRFWLDRLNMKHRRQSLGRLHGLPESFKGQIDAARQQRSDAYALAGDRVALVEGVFGFVVTLVFMFGGLLPWYDRLAASCGGGFVVRGLLFFAVLALLQLLLGIPFSLYRNFVLEEKFGFNRMSLRLWMADLVKSVLVGSVLFVVMVGGALWLVQLAPGSWWLWVWGFWACLSVFLLLISPYLIEPLFYKFTPLSKTGLEQGVRELLAKAGVQAGKVLQVDASRRSGHSNAYFTGIGRVKRVVLFDTLLEQLDNQELLAVLAHELGHWRCGHLRQHLLKSQIVALVTCGGAYWLLHKGILPAIIGIESLSFYAQLVVLGWLAGLLGFFWTPCSSWWSRRHERQADQFAVDLTGGGQDLATGLVKLARENLSNLFPHPLYVFFYYSHPPLVERVAGLEQLVPGAEYAEL